MADQDTPHVESLNLSGLPFQLAVLDDMRHMTGTQNFIVTGEVPWRAGDRRDDASGFVDIVAIKAGPLYLAFLIECKKATDKTWRFLHDDRDYSDNISRCRLEWFNPRVEAGINNESPFFCDDWTMARGSVESDVCVLPKGHREGTKMIEEDVRALLEAGRALIGDHSFGVKPDDQILVLVPVIVTNAKLFACKANLEELNLESGELTDATCSEVEIVRFRKTLAYERSNSYRRDKLELGAWVADRVRTSFIVRPSALRSFFDGFRSFARLKGGLPDEYARPPEPLAVGD